METNDSIDADSRVTSLSNSNTHIIRIRSSREGQDLPSSPGARLWHSACRKILSAVPDPWGDFDLQSNPTITAVRHRYSALKKKWVKDTILVKLEEKPFNRGAMRECFRLKKLPDGGTWKSAFNYVAKRYISPVSNSVYLDDVRLQMEAKLWAEAFNRQNPPKKVDVFQMSVIEVLPESPDSPPPTGETKRRGSTTLVTTPSIPRKAKSSQFYHIERYMDGEYRKYNSNSGYVDEKPRNTPQAFSHFTFEHSGHRLLVVDIQGVGDLYTDPQIHTFDGLGYNEGNLGLRGMALFFHSHRCNPLCEALRLAPFDLSDNELTELYCLDDSAADAGDGSPLDQQFDVELDECISPDAPDSVSPTSGRAFMASTDNKEEDHSLTASLTDESEAVAAAAAAAVVQQKPQQHLKARKRSLSIGMIPMMSNGQPCPSPSSVSHRLMAAAARQLYGPTVSRDEEFRNGVTPRRRFRTFSGSADAEQNPPTAASMPLTKLQPLHVPSSSVEAIELTDSPFLDSAFDVDSASSWDDEVFGRPKERRTRNISECSDVDNDMMLMAGSGNPLLTHHETHKPANAKDPSNMDQEIGQSILGKLHHELARLHETGRFSKRRSGGWSENGLGGLKLDGGDAEAMCESIDWASVLFHERLAAQLGCLEALIIMAHYFLGLPTQLLSDCPIKASEADLGLGVDYLWRSCMGGDRRCMILFARYLDASVVFGTQELARDSDNHLLLDREVIRSKLNLRTTPVDDFLVLLSSHRGFPMPAASAAGRHPWLDAAAWYRRAIDTALAGGGGPEADEGYDAEGRYDSAEDLSPVHRLIARLAEMHQVGGYGLRPDPGKAGDLYTEAAEAATKQANGRLAAKYFELADEAYAMVDDGAGDGD